MTSAVTLPHVIIGSAMLGSTAVSIYTRKAKYVVGVATTIFGLGFAIFTGKKAYSHRPELALEKTVKILGELILQAGLFASVPYATTFFTSHEDAKERVIKVGTVVGLVALTALAFCIGRYGLHQTTTISGRHIVRFGTMPFLGGVATAGAFLAALSGSKFGG